MTAEVLIVDDNQLTRRLVREILAADQFLTFREATDGLEAVACIHARRPDVVILDVEMPRLSGLDLYHILKADPELADISIVVVTGQSTVQQEFVGLDGQHF